MSVDLEEMSAFFNNRALQYDSVHVATIDGGAESKRVLASFFPENAETLIDLGIGTGLELEAIFARFPDIRVTGYDIAEGMLKLLAEKYPGKTLDLRLESYLSADFGRGAYDAALSVMTLHHYGHEAKTAIYRKIFDCLRPGGVYIECDYILSDYEYDDPQKAEDEIFERCRQLRAEQSLDGGAEYHFDTPCTVGNQKKMLASAGFREIKEVWQIKNTIVLTATKQNNLESCRISSSP
ncbi:MAG: class I SAM-dependent methyltransferase [Clostridiales Family XIII bacterium]|jgi:tRNA (cmo5U34)-methyltransferase|nr:class I SAM-dependent methyltransferase [Clostridiales Family XIII bacterium]